MDVTFMGAEHKLAGRAPGWHYRYRTALAVLLPIWLAPAESPMTRSRSPW